ncbi:hypothetical protein MML48_1g15482 [Holotrichia oblita]|uniref:Uncharacterized protein n=1 Tax=Holotrichia oblita TaxID=644536 RepID=A0ACB9TZR4_HOLOL|nr:hypothetical protein MML48_1g15482 [Holotrichia oblita]
MNDLRNNSWVQGNQMFPQTPLMTPDILSSSGSTERGLQTTFNAFHKAHKEGFRLQDVSSAKLAQRRRLKKSSSDNNSTSSSSFTSECSLKSGPNTPLSSRPKHKTNRNESDQSSNTKASPGSSENKDNVFCFGEARVKEYLRTMSTNPDQVASDDITNTRTLKTNITEERYKQNESSQREQETIIENQYGDTSTQPKTKRKRRVFEKTRQSERIQKMQREKRTEIDVDPLYPITVKKDSKTEIKF